MQPEVVLAVGSANEHDTIAEAMRKFWNCMMAARSSDLVKAGR